MFLTDTEKIIKKLNRRLSDIRKVGMPTAAAATLNNMAYQSRQQSIKNFEKGRVIRNNWSEKGMRFEQTKKNIPIRMMESRAGSIRDYADIQETGGIVTPDSKFVPIPSLTSRRGSKKKRVTGRFKIDKIGKVRRLPKISGSKKRRFAAMLNLARKERKFGPFLVTNEEAGSEKMPRGIFELRGRGRLKRGGGQIKVLRKLKKSVIVPGRPFIQPAAKKIGKNMDEIYVKNANRLLKKYGRDIK